MAYDWDFSIIYQYWPTLLKASIVTLELFFLCVIAGTILGFVLGITLKFSIKPIRKITMLFVDLVKSLPELVLILWFYYFLPIITGVGNLSAFFIAFVALSLNLSVFIADYFRGAVDNINKNHIDGALALGMSKFQIIVYVIVPEAFRMILTPVSSMYIHVLKMTSLASIIAVNELTHTANLLALNTFRSIEIFSVVGVIYIILVLPLTYLLRKVENLSDLGVRKEWN